MTIELDRAPGQFAEERYRRRLWAWRRRVWWAFPLMVVWIMAVCLLLGFVFYREHLELLIGVGIGSGLTSVMFLVDDAPTYVTSWRQGAEGERMTAQALKGLGAQWQVQHDVKARYGNHDHIVYGPGGVFLVETKNLSGRLVVEEGRLVSHYPGDSAPQPHSDIAGRARGAAAGLSSVLSGRGARVWVTPLLAVWGDFEQERVEGEGVTWVHGSRLVSIIEEKEGLHPADVDVIESRLGDLSLLERPRSVGPPG